MILLLDSHALVWLHESPGGLSQKASDAITDRSNSLFLSAASVWELQIKIGLGKLALSDDLANVLRLQKQVNQLRFLSVTIRHAIYLKNLPSHHSDPFDRLLISQAFVEKMTSLPRIKSLHITM